MTESNKILTVSYGTFSCTLEGFDDPFGTMRGIAEYFRDLAAEDRYFGAEPPTPDVEMLQNIAQRDVQRRVEARIGESGVALRAADAVEDAELSDPAPAPVETPKAETAHVDATDVSDTAPLAFDDEYLMADEPEDAFVVDASATIDAEPAPESIAEKLRRIRAVVSRNIDTGSDDSSPFSDAGGDAASAFAQPQEKRERALSETIRSISADLSDDDDIDALNPADPVSDDGSVPLYPDEAVEDDAEPEVEAVSTDMDETDDAEFETDEDDAPVEDEDAFDEAETEAEAEVEAEAVAEAEVEADATEVEADVEVEAEAEPEVETEDEIAAFADDDAQTEDDASDDDLSDYDEEYEDDAEDQAEDDQASILAGVLAATAASDADEADDEDDAVEATPEKSAQLEPLSETNGNVGRLLKETDEKLAEDEGIRRRRVISQMRAAVAATKAERVLSKPVSPDQLAKEEQSPYRRDLSQVMPSDMSANTSEAPSTPEVDETEDEVEVEETRVDEVEASVDAEADVSEAEEAPVADAPKPTPLVLVSSQRVDDTPPVEAPKPVKPAKRVVSEAGTFAAFAEEMGAEELPDLLEAAAAFSAFVENQPHFSRPDIMKRVARVDPALSLSREAGLRSFGMLLRQGKIRKLQRGQFTIAEDTRFNPAHRIAGE